MAYKGQREVVFKDLKTVRTLDDNKNSPIMVKLIMMDETVCIDARKYYIDRFGEYKPTGKGIFLNVEQIDDICAALTAAKHEFQNMINQTSNNE